LVERRGELVSKQDVTARIWPNLFVDPSNLPQQVSALRRALRDGQDGNRFIINVKGRGYRFVASVEVSA
jgi:DNA-binding winged helix-turn-helix (wHTH) protein